MHAYLPLVQANRYAVRDGCNKTAANCGVIAGHVTSSVEGAKAIFSFFSASSLFMP